MPRYLAKIALHDLLDRRNSFGLFGQDDLPNHGINIGIRKLHANRKTPLQLFEVARPCHRRLPRPNEQKFAADILTARLDDFLHLDRTLAVFTDILLYFVQNDKRQRHLAVLRQGLSHHFEHLIARNIGHIRIQIVQRFCTASQR